MTSNLSSSRSAKNSSITFKGLETSGSTGAGISNGPSAREWILQNPIMQFILLIAGLWTVVVSLIFGYEYTMGFKKRTAFEDIFPHITRIAIMLVIAVAGGLVYCVYERASEHMWPGAGPEVTQNSAVADESKSGSGLLARRSTKLLGTQAGSSEIRRSARLSNSVRRRSTRLSRSPRE